MGQALLSTSANDGVALHQHRQFDHPSRKPACNGALMQERFMYVVRYRLRQASLSCMLPALLGAPLGLRFMNQL
jgi:hypothetical protein